MTGETNTPESIIPPPIIMEAMVAVILGPFKSWSFPNIAMAMTKVTVTNV